MELNLKALDRFMEHLPKNGDVELGLLKCHLLVEEVLTKLITRASRRPDFILKTRLTFAQKIWLARSFADLEREEWVWSALKKLNEARNELSHGLAPEQISQKLEDFIAVVEASRGELSPDEIGPTFGRFQWAAFKLFTCLS